MDRTAKRVGIAVISVLLVALICAGIALIAPRQEQQTAPSAGNSAALNTDVRAVTVGETAYDLNDRQQATAYYNALVGQGYKGITDQSELNSWVRTNGGTSGARAALKPYSDDGTAISYYFGNSIGNAESPYYGAVMAADDIFRATIDGCGSEVELIVNGVWENSYSNQMSSSEAISAIAPGDALMFSQTEQVAFTGGLANIAVGANVSNFDFVINRAAIVVGQFNDEGEFVYSDKQKAIITGGLFGASVSTNINNCALTYTDNADISGKKLNGDNNPGYGLLVFGGLVGYTYKTTVSNVSIETGGTIWLYSNGSGSGWVVFGNPRTFVGGAIGITQGITMYNITVTGNGMIYADIGDEFSADTPSHSRAGALIGANFTAVNSEVSSFGWKDALSGTSVINGIITNYTGETGFVAGSGRGSSSKNWVTYNGMLFGSAEPSAASNIFYHGDSVASNAKFCYNQSYTAIPINASVANGGGTAEIYFANEQSSDVSSLQGPQVTYTAPSTSGALLWDYSLNNGAATTMYDQMRTTYTLTVPRTTSDTYIYSFNTGTAVRYHVYWNSANVTDQCGVDAEPIATKQFDNTAYGVPTLQVWNLEGSSNLGDLTDTKYWEITNGTQIVDISTAVDANTWSYRLADNFASGTTYDFVDSDLRYVAYKSDNSDGALRIYNMEITPKDVTVSYNDLDLVYNREAKNFTFTIDSLVSGDYAAGEQPEIDVTYYDALGGEITPSQVVNAGNYSVTVNGIADTNYTITNLEDLADHAFEVTKRTLTVTVNGADGMSYNGAPKTLDVAVGNLISEGDEIVNIVYFAAGNENVPLNEDDRINAGDYVMVASLADPSNYVIDTTGAGSDESLTVTETSVRKTFTVAKADLEFSASADGTYTFVYGPNVVRTLSALNAALGNTSYYFQPADETNTVDSNLGGNVRLNITEGPQTQYIYYVGSYTLTVTYSSSNFNEKSADMTVIVTERPLTLDLTAPEETSFVYGTTPSFHYSTSATGALANDKLRFDIVYYTNDGDGVVKEENKLGAQPTAVGSYIASLEAVGSGFGEEILDNYYINPDSNNTFAYQIDKKAVTVTYGGSLQITYNGEEQTPVTISAIDGVIDSEQELYNVDTATFGYYVEQDGAPTGDALDSIRNAGSYIAMAAFDEAFYNNYSLNSVTVVVDRAPITLRLNDIELEYLAAVGADIPYEEGFTFTIESGEIFGTDDDGTLFELFVIGDENSDGTYEELDSIPGLGSLLYSIRLNSGNANAANYELTLIASEGAAEYPNLAAQYTAGTVLVTGTPLYTRVGVYDEEGNRLMGFTAAEDQMNVYTIAYPYAAGNLTVKLEILNRAGVFESLEFETVTVDGSVEAGTDENGLPYFVVRNVKDGGYTATFKLTADAYNVFYFKTSDTLEGSEDMSDTITVNFTLTPIEATIAPNDVEMTYGSAFADNGWSVVGDDDGSIAAILAKDGVTAQIEASSVGADTGFGVYEGAAAITSVGYGAGIEANYSLTYGDTASVSVLRKEITVEVTPSQSSVTYGDAAPTEFTITSEGFVNGDGEKPEVTSAIAEQLTYGEGRLNAGTHYVGLVQNEIGNYKVTLAENTGELTVNKKTVEIDVANGVTEYGSGAIVPATDGVWYDNEPDFVADDAITFGMQYNGEGDLSALEPGTSASGVVTLVITDEAMAGNYELNITSYGDLTVSAMELTVDKITVTPASTVYTGEEISYEITGVVTDHLTVTIEKNGEEVEQLLGAGEYVFTFVGDGTYYEGTAEVTVTIAKAQLPEDVALSVGSADYTGSSLEDLLAVGGGYDVVFTIMRDGAQAELVNAGTYDIVITASESDPNYTGSVTRQFVVNKATYAIPSRSELTVTVTWNGVTVTAADGKIVEISTDNGDWSDGKIGGLDPETEYTLTVRYKADDNHYASGTTQIVVTTSARVAYELSADDVTATARHDSVTLSVDSDGTPEFSIDGGRTWQDASVFEGLDESSSYTISVRIKADSTHEASSVVTVTVSTGLDPAKFNETLATFGDTFTAADLDRYATLTEQYNGLTEADRADIDSAAYNAVVADYNAYVASLAGDISDAQDLAAKTAGMAGAAAAAVSAAALALFLAKRKFNV